jgi:hypothetical protein
MYGEEVGGIHLFALFRLGRAISRNESIPQQESAFRRSCHLGVHFLSD